MVSWRISTASKSPAEMRRPARLPMMRPPRQSTSPRRFPSSACPVSALRHGQQCAGDPRPEFRRRRRRFFDLARSSSARVGRDGHDRLFGDCRRPAARTARPWLVLWPIRVSRRPAGIPRRVFTTRRSTSRSRRTRPARRSFTRPTAAFRRSTHGTQIAPTERQRDAVRHGAYHHDDGSSRGSVQRRLSADQH